MVLNNRIPTLFLIMVITTSISCFDRPDYNLPLFLFAYMIWALEDVRIYNNKWIKLNLNNIFPWIN